MEKLPDISMIPIERFKDNELLLYFATLNDDERIETRFESAEKEIVFDFMGKSSQIIHHQLLPENSIDENNESQTLFHASGNYTIGENSKFQVTLTSVEGETPHRFTLISGDDGNVITYEKDWLNFTSMDLKAFGDLSLRASNAKPTKVRTALNKRRGEAVFDSPEDAYEYWGEHAQQRQGQFIETGVIHQTIANNEEESVEIRLARKEHELPYKSIRELVVEYATQMHRLDAEIVYRLELRYESTINDQHGFEAKKRVVSGCERELVKARLTSRTNTGVVTPLDINDKSLMKQFRGALEILLADE